MKRIAVFLPILLLLVAALRAQTFEVVNPTSLSINLTSQKGEAVNDNIVIHNKTANQLNLQLRMRASYSYGWKIANDSTVIRLDANATLSVSVVFRPWQARGEWNHWLEITDSNTIITLSLKGSVNDRCYSIDSNMAEQSGLYMTGIPVGKTTCVKLYAANKKTDPMIIYSAGLSPGNPDQDSSASKIQFLVPLPYVLLPGEEVPYAEICYTPLKPNEYAQDELFQEYTPVYNNFRFGNIFLSSEYDSLLAKPCLEFIRKPANLIGPVMIGGDGFDTVIVKSNRKFPVQIKPFQFMYGDSDVFSTVEKFPITVPPLGNASYTIKFSPHAKDTLVKYRYGVHVGEIFSDSCGKLANEDDIAGLAFPPTADSTATPLFPDKEYVLGMSGAAPSFSQDFHFVNNGPQNVKVTAVSLSDPSPEFAITGIQPTNVLPFTLAPGGKMTVTVLFTPSKPGVLFYNQIVITTEVGAQSVSFPLQGLQLLPEGVKQVTQENVAMSLVPNPAHREVSVSITGAEKVSRCELYDALGRVLMSSTGNTILDWQLDPSLASGVYFIRAEGVAVDGNPFIATKRLIVE
jgi:hypothetical protein